GPAELAAALSPALRSPPCSAPSAEEPPAPTGRLLRCGLGRLRRLRRRGGPQLPPPLRRVVPVPRRGEHGLEGVRAAVAVDALGEVLGVLARGALRRQLREGPVALLELLAQQHHHGQQRLAIDV